MRIKLITTCSDHDLPVLDIEFNDASEAFAMGRIFETITEASLCAWRTEAGIRIPLVIANDLGLVDKSVLDRKAL